MNGKVTISLLLCFLALVAPAHNDAADKATEEAKCELAVLREWKAGEKVRPESVEQFGRERCFESSEITDALFKRIYKKSFKETCPLPREELRYIKALHYNADQEICLGEVICNKAICDDLIAIFKALYEARYPIERMVLIDEYNADDELSMRDNNSSCFNFRLIPGTTKLSSHSMGYAIDINPLYNPCVRRSKGKVICQPENAGLYIDRSADFPYKIDHDDRCFKEFKKRGFTWGGDWSSLKDYQHFEKVR